MVTDAEKRLALAVLALAADDAAMEAAQQLAAERQQTARAFLAGGPMLAFWCMLAGLDAHQVTQTARTRWC